MKRPTDITLTELAMECLSGGDPCHSDGGTGLMVSTVRESADLDGLEVEWRELFQRVQCEIPFLSPEWMMSWWKKWGEGHTLHVAAVRDRSGRLVALGPFYIRRSRLPRRAARALCFLADRHVGSEYLNILVDPGFAEPAAAVIADWLVGNRTEWDYLELVGADQESPVFQSLCRGFKAKGMWECQIWSGLCPYIPLPQSFEGFLGTVGSNLRYNFRRRLRALEREGRLEFQTVREWPSILPAYNALTGLHGVRFRQKRESSDFLIDRVQRFHMDALHEMAAGGMAWLNLLKVDEKPVAALYGFSTGKRFSFYQSGMDPAWSRLSAGLVLLGLSIQEAIRTGHEEFDLLEGDQEYKRQWASHHRSIATQCFFDRRTKSRLAWAHVWTIRELKKIKARFR